MHIDFIESFNTEGYSVELTSPLCHGTDGRQKNRNNRGLFQNSSEKVQNLRHFFFFCNDYKQAQGAKDKEFLLTFSMRLHMRNQRCRPPPPLGPNMT